MSEIDARLVAALKADAAPAHDVMFRLETLARLERLRFGRRLALTGAVAAAAMMGLAVYAPPIGRWMAAEGWHACLVALGATAPLFSLLPGMRDETVRGGQALARALDRWLYQ